MIWQHIKKLDSEYDFGRLITWLCPKCGNSQTDFEHTLAIVCNRCETQFDWSQVEEEK